jgi:Raf kinase inhibitor-like YbhB/YbcL family protein
MNKRNFFFIILFLLSVCRVSAQQTPKAHDSAVTILKMKLTSTSFENDSLIPKRFTCDGDNISPQLFWGGVPDKTKSVAIICEDPDAPNGTFVHWVIYNIPHDSQALLPNRPATEVLPHGVRQGKNGAGKFGYTGPCPPPGKLHHYHFSVLALDEMLNLTGDVTRDKLTAAIKGHVLGIGHLVGTYQR